MEIVKTEIAILILDTWLINYGTNIDEFLCVYFVFFHCCRIAIFTLNLDAPKKIRAIVIFTRVSACQPNNI